MSPFSAFFCVSLLFIASCVQCWWTTARLDGRPPAFRGLPRRRVTKSLRESFRQLPFPALLGALHTYENTVSSVGLYDQVQPENVVGRWSNDVWFNSQIVFHYKKYSYMASSRYDLNSHNFLGHSIVYNDSQSRLFPFLRAPLFIVSVTNVAIHKSDHIKLCTTRDKFMAAIEKECGAGKGKLCARIAKAMEDGSALECHGHVYMTEDQSAGGFFKNHKLTVIFTGGRPLEDL